MESAVHLVRLTIVNCRSLVGSPLFIAEVTSQLYRGIPTVTRLAPYEYPLDCSGYVDMMMLPEENLTVDEQIGQQVLERSGVRPANEAQISIYIYVHTNYIQLPTYYCSCFLMSTWATTQSIVPCVLMSLSNHSIP